MKSKLNNKMNCNNKNEIMWYVFHENLSQSQKWFPAEMCCKLPEPKHPYTHKFQEHRDFKNWLHEEGSNGYVIGCLSFEFDKYGNCIDINGLAVPKFDISQDLPVPGRYETTYFGMCKEVVEATISTLGEKSKDFPINALHYVDKNNGYYIRSNFKGTPTKFLEGINGIVIPVIPNSKVYIAQASKGYFDTTEVQEIFNTGYKISTTFENWLARY